MKYFILFLVVIGLICLPVSAYTFDNIEVNLENGAYLSFPYVMTHDGTFNQSYAYFQFWVNSSNLTFSTGSNRTVIGVALNNVTDNYSFSSSGSVGWFNFSATMVNASNNYSFYINDSYVESRNTTASKQVYFNYTVSDITLKSYKINWTVSAGSSPVVDTNTTPSLSSVTNQTAQARYTIITYTVNQSNAITRVRYGTTQAMTGSSSNQTSDTDRQDNLTVLQNNTLYYYTVDAWNSTNTSYYVNSSIQNFTTAEDYIDLPDPNITSWGNNYTNNESLILYVEENTLVDFNITVNQSVDTYYWTVSSATALGHSEYNFTSHGTKYVTGRASNTNGSTQTITWTVNVNDTYPYVFPANSDTDLFIVNKNVVRKLNTETNEYVYKIILLKPVVTKVVTDTDQIYFNTLDRAYIVNKQNGSILHSYYFGRAELISNISVDSKNMNFNTESYIYSLNKTTGQLVQKFKLDDSSIYQ